MLPQLDGFENYQQWPECKVKRGVNADFCTCDKSGSPSTRNRAMRVTVMHLLFPFEYCIHRRQQQQG